jgi:hypothetical protein
MLFIVQTCYFPKPPWRLSRNPDMKIGGRAADFCGTKEKREENETMISMVKKANAFFFPGSPFLFLSFFSHDFHRKKRCFYVSI